MDCNQTFYFHILDVNVNEWILVKGCMLGIWTDGPYGVNTTSVETMDGGMIIRLYKLYVG